MENYVLVVNDEGVPFYDEERNLLVRRVSDGVEFYVAEENITQITNDNNITETDTVAERETVTESETTQRDEENNARLFWTREKILSLIHLYKMNKHHFASTTMKNIKVWQKIANELGSHNAKQCENKFKYLKAKYLQKKDNMSIRSSGAGTIYFQYYEEMHDLLGKEPIVEPIAIASSSRPNLVELQERSPLQSLDNRPQSETEAVPSNPEGRPKKTIKLRDALKDLNNILKEAEEAKQRRHEELLHHQKESMQQFSEIMNKILEKM